MNSLPILLCTVTVLGWAGWHQQSRLTAQRSNNAELRRRAEALTVRLDDLQRELARVRQQTLEQRTKTDSLQAEHSAEIAREDQASVPAPNPAREGFWPEGQPYFHLRKGLLSNIGYVVLDATGALSDATAVLFGLNAQERRAIESAWAEAQRRRAELQAERAIRLEPEPGHNTPEHPEISFRLPALAGEADELAQQLGESLKAAVGPFRGGLLLEQLRPEMEFGLPAEERTIIYSAWKGSDGVMHKFEIQSANQSRTSTSGSFEFPMNPEHPGWEFRHLLGMEPLLRSDPSHDSTPPSPSEAPAPTDPHAR